MISWNEFSENTHIEPSREFGVAYLRQLAEYLGRSSAFAAIGDVVGNVPDFDSSSPDGQSGTTEIVFFVVGLVVLVATVGGVGYYRRRPEATALNSS